MTVTYPPGPAPHRWTSILRTARSLRSIVSDPLGFVGSRFAEHGDLYHVDEGGGSHLLVTRHPDVIRNVLVTRASAFQKRGGANDRLAAILGDGLLTADGDTWKRNRRLLQPAFHGDRITGYATTMVEHARQVRWPDGETLDVSHAMIRLTLAIVCKTLFDHDVTDEADRVAATMEALRQSTRPSLVPGWVPTPRRRRTASAMASMDALIAGLLEERRAHGLRDDLLSELLRVDMDDRQRRDELVTLFLAGHETTSHALSWTWWLLSQHLDAEAKLHDELDRVLGGRSPTVADLPSLPYTAHVIDESLRLFPPAFAVARVARTDTELGGYDVPAGTQVVCWIWHCHHDGRWFASPERFWPERFVEPAFPKHAYLPFGAGSRKCIGSGFASMELRLLLAELAQRYRLRSTIGQQVGLSPQVTLAPKGGLPLRVEHR